MKRALVVASSLLFLAAYRSSAQPSLVDTVWLHLEGDWIESPPDDDAPSTRAAPAALIVFSDSHDFSMLRCWIYEIKKDPSRVQISPGDPHLLYIGTWESTGRSVSVDYRLIYELVQPVGGGKYPGPKLESRVTIGPHSIDFGGVTYTASPIEYKNYETFIRPYLPGPAKERAALEFLRKGHQPVSTDNLGVAAMHADADLVVALLDAGVDVNATGPGGLTPLGEAGGPGCVGSEATVQARLATIDALVQHGANVKWRDSLDNTILMHGVQCPVPVVARLVAFGAPFDVMNAQGSTPLQVAFAEGKWDVAEFLVGRGARVSKQAMDQLFFEKPTDPKKLALIRRATAK